MTVPKQQQKLNSNSKPPSIPGVNVILMGPAGSGKTFSIGTLVDTGIETFYLALEPGLESLLGYYKDRDKPIPDNLHWHIQEAPAASFTELIDSATKINTLSYQGLAKLQDPKRNKYNTFIQLLKDLSDFPDDRTQKKFGSVDSWGADRALVIDGMTGLGRAVMSMIIGGKPIKSVAEWGIAQDQLERILQQLTANCKCHFILIAHIERETDEILGGIKLMISTLGKKLTPKIPPMFSDVILTVREGTQWFWDTASQLADVKTRNLPIKKDNAPDFGKIINKWKSRS